MDPRIRDQVLSLIFAFALVFIWGAVIPLYINRTRSFSLFALESALGSSFTEGIGGGMLLIIGGIFTIAFLRYTIRIAREQQKYGN
jgi:TRAP-type C4-dicarboxylate transport system permease small subunit